jgi:hypothetical protein
VVKLVSKKVSPLWTRTLYVKRDAGAVIHVLSATERKLIRELVAGPKRAGEINMPERSRRWAAARLEQQGLLHRDKGLYSVSAPINGWAVEPTKLEYRPFNKIYL